jgi:SOS-response transcriptional repressor LexA
VWYNIYKETQFGKTEAIMNYIERINMLKKERKITNQDLAQMTDIPLGTLSKMLAGYSFSPKLSYIVSIATAFNVSIDYLISGTEENNNNYTLTDEEIKHIEKLRALPERSRALVEVVMDKEFEMIAETERKAAASEESSKKAKVLRTLPEGFERKEIPLFDLPVSAGPGEFLGTDSAARDSIKINVTSATSTASYAVRVHGNSMEPKYKNGDTLIVEECNSVEYGELGIFVLDGDGYFKRFEGDRLVSLNPDYGDILLNQFNEAVCCGRVLGKLKKR